MSIPACANAVTTPSRSEIAQEIARQLSARGPGKSICPSEVARALADDWRGVMDEVRAAAGEMMRDGRLRVTQGDADVDPEEASGPIRLRLPQDGRRP